MIHSIDEIRKKASELHEKLCGNGISPFSPYELVKKEAENRDIEVNCLPENHAQLEGAEALFNPEAKIINHKETDNIFLNAYLVAHELGHSIFDKNNTIEVTNNTFSIVQTAIEPISETDKLIDYSHYSRREVRLDIFAREFLFPRNLAKKWYIDDGLTIEQISSNLGAPKNLVSVQVWDAILLPTIEKSKQSSNKKLNLNDEQRTAASHVGNACLIKAGPGTGKTQTLIGRLDYLRSIGTDPNSILVLTFSNKAASEIEERAIELWPEITGNSWIGTFHSFGFDIIKRYHDRVNLPQSVKLLEEVEAINLLEDVFPFFELTHFKSEWDNTRILRDILDAISRAKDEVIYNEDYRKLSEKMLENAKSEEEKQDADKCIEIAAVFDKYEEMKTDLKAVDYGDMVAKATILLETDDQVRAKLQKLYQNVLVDEYQDVNLASVRLLRALKPNGKDLWVVGDEKQSIYRFRGATSNNINQFDNNHFPNGTVQNLAINYRSSQEICNTFKEFSYDEMGINRKDYQVIAENGDSRIFPKFISVVDKNSECDEIYARIKEAEENGVHYRDQVVLCRGNDRLAEIAKSLEQRDIPILYLGPLFNRPEVKQALSLLSLVVDPRAMGIACIAHIPEYKLSLQDVAHCFEILENEKDLSPLEWRDILPSLPNLSVEASKNITKLSSDFRDFSPYSKPWTVLTQLLFEKTKFAERLHKDLNNGNSNPAIAIWHLNQFIRNTNINSSGFPIRNMLDRFTQMALLSKDRVSDLPIHAENVNAVQLMTIHGSKGLEFKCVHLASLTNNTIPKNENSSRKLAPPDGMIVDAPHKGIDAIKAGHKEEEKCIFFVALSRAKEELILYAPEKNLGGQTQQKSIFIDRIKKTLTNCKPIGQSSRIATLDNKVDINFENSPTFTASQIDIYKKCPRRFFYSSILKLGGKRRETSLMKVYRVVQSTIEELRKRFTESVSIEKMKAIMEEAWKSYGPTSSIYAGKYKEIAKKHIKFLFELRSTGKRKKAKSELFSIGNYQIAVTVDEEIFENGTTTYRRIKTGRRSDRILDSMDSAIFQYTFSASGEVEIAFISDELCEKLSMTDRKIETRLQKIENFLDEISDGKFPPKPSRDCPGCPYYFNCSTIPDGKLSKQIIVNS